MRAPRISPLSIALAAAALALAPRAAAGPEPTARILSSRDRWEVGDVARVTVSRTGTATVRESAPGGAVEVESVPLGARMDTCLLRCLEVTEDGDPRRLQVFVEDWARDDGDRLDPCLKWGFVEVSGTGAAARWRRLSSPAPLSDAARTWLDAWFGKDGARDDVRLRAALPDRAVRVGETWQGALASFRGGPGALGSPGLCDPPEGTVAGFRLVNVEGVRAAQVRGEADWTLPAVPALPLPKVGSWPKGLEVHEEADVYLPAQRARGYRAEVYADARAVGTYDGREARLHLAFATVVDVAFGDEMPDPPPPADAPGRAVHAIAREEVARAGDVATVEERWRSDVRIAPVASVGPPGPERTTSTLRQSLRAEEVLEASPSGRATKRLVRFEAWSLDRNGQADASLAGRALVVTSDDSALDFTLEPSEPPPSAAAARWLEAEYGSGRAEFPDARASVLPAPGIAVAVGDAWTPAAAGGAERGRGERGIDPERATGVARLVAVLANVAHVEAEFWLPMRPGATALRDADLRWMRGAGMAVSVTATYGLDGRPVPGPSATRARILGRARRGDGSAVNVAAEVVEESKADVPLAAPGGR